MNRMEGVISPDHEDGPTMRRISGYLSGEITEPEAVSWDAEGGREPASSSSDRQLYQCAQAAKFLLVEHVHSDLSVDMIIRTHEIMMTHSYDSLRPRFPRPVVVGRMRELPEEDVNAGWYQFCRLQLFRARCQSLSRNTIGSPWRARCTLCSLLLFLFYGTHCHPSML